jgi:hypothetical protein
LSEQRVPPGAMKDSRVRAIAPPQVMDLIFIA